MKVRFLVIGFVVLALLLPTVVFANPFELRVRASGQVFGNLDDKIGVSGVPTFTFNGAYLDIGVNGGAGVAAEGLYSILPYLQIGVGVEYQVPRSMINPYPGVSNPGTFQFLPIYGIVKVPLDFPLPVRPYFVGRAGYNFVWGDSNFIPPGGSLSTGGFYYALGGGIEFPIGNWSVFAEATYTGDNCTLSVNSPPFTSGNSFYSYLNASLGVSYSF